MLEQVAEREVLGGTDGFRGVARFGDEPGRMNEQTLAGLTYALVDLQLEAGATGPVVVSQDTRPSSCRLRGAVIAGAREHGVEVWDLGVAPTPMAQKVAREMGGMATVVVTASHNPYTDNGWKGMPGSDKPARDMVRTISDRYWEQVDSRLVVPSRLRAGREATQRPDQLFWYTDELVKDVQTEFGERPLDGKLFVVDGANGAGMRITPHVLERLGATVETYACDGQGKINENCGAASLSGLKNFLRGRLDILDNPNFVGAIANDGDADRMMGVGVVRAKNGEIQLVEIDGNHVMGALAQGEPGIVGTEYTNSGLVRRLEQQGIGFEWCANGDVFVTEKLRELQANGQAWRYGGEFTGHHVATDWLSSGDGVRMAAWFASYAAKHDLTFGQIHQDLPLWPETMMKVPLQGSESGNIKDNEEVQTALAAAAQQLGPDGRIILRASGTEPVVRVWGEGVDANQIDRVVAALADVVVLRNMAA